MREYKVTIKSNLDTIGEYYMHSDGNVEVIHLNTTIHLGELQRKLELINSMVGYCKSHHRTSLEVTKV